MEVVDDISRLEAHEAASQPFCVMARPTDRGLIEAATSSLGLTHDKPLDEPNGHLHPRAYVEGEDVFVLAFSLEGLKPLPVQLLAANGGLLVIAADEALAVVRTEVPRVEADGRVALARILVGLGRAAGGALDDLTDEVRDIAARAMGFTSSPERSELTEMRAGLFTAQQLCAAHESLLGPDEDLVRSLPKTTSAHCARRARRSPTSAG
jgi:hypothetical protein